MGDCVRLVHFMRNLLAQVPKSAQSLVAAAARSIFEQPDRATGRHTLREVGSILQSRFPKVVALLEEAEGNILSFHDFPSAHRRQIHSTNPLEVASSQTRISVWSGTAA